jgi:DNA polymerase III sliding clamp (beta) subunit (PCNA family)
MTIKFVVSKSKLKKLLEFSSINKELDTIWWKYDSNGIAQIQVDSAFTIMVLSKINKSYFTEYTADGEGEIKIPTYIYDVVDKYFKEVTSIEFSVEGNNLYLKSKNENYKSSLLSVELPKPDIKIEEKDYGLIPTLKAKVNGVYGIDSEEWSIKSDKVKIEYGETLKLTVELEGGSSYTRYTKIFDKHDITGSGDVLLNGEMFKNIVDLFEGPLYIIFTEGPVILSQKTSEYSISYVLAPLTE